MGIVELDGAMGGKPAQVVAPHPLIAPDDILQAGAGEEILLLEPQPLALIGGIIGIKHPGDILHLVLFPDGQVVFLVVEQGEVKLLHRFALPEPEGAYVAGMIPDDGHIVGHGKDGLVRKGDGNGLIIPPAGPGVPIALPVVRLFHLETVFNGLLKQAEFVPDAVAVHGKIQCGRAIQETGGKAAQAAIAQRRVLDILHYGQIRAPGSQELAHLIQQAQTI